MWHCKWVHVFCWYFLFGFRLFVSNHLSESLSEIGRPLVCSLSVFTVFKSFCIFNYRMCQEIPDFQDANENEWKKKEKNLAKWLDQKQCWKWRERDRDRKRGKWNVHAGNKYRWKQLINLCHNIKLKIAINFHPRHMQMNRYACKVGASVASIVLWMA